MYHRIIDGIGYMDMEVEEVKKKYFEKEDQPANRK